MLVQLAGVEVEIVGEATDAYFAAVMAHAASMTDVVEAIALLPSDIVIFDVGANLGLSSIAMAIAKPAARIFAFEPSPVTFAQSSPERGIIRQHRADPGRRVRSAIRSPLSRRDLCRRLPCRWIRPYRVRDADRGS